MLIKRTIINTSLINTAMLLMMIVTVTACQSSTTPLPATDDKPRPVVTECKDPRKPFCTKEYRPVCASKDTGVRCVTTPCPSTEEVTYSNGCTACADEKVYSYVAGACQ